MTRQGVPAKLNRIRSEWAVQQSEARIFHELLSRDYEDGRATGQLVPRYRGIGSEAYLNDTSQGPPVLSEVEGTPEDARKDSHIRGRSK